MIAMAVFLRLYHLLSFLALQSPVVHRPRGDGPLLHHNAAHQLRGEWTVDHNGCFLNTTWKPTKNKGVHWFHVIWSDFIWIGMFSISCDLTSQSYDIQSLQLVLSSGEWRELRTEVICGGLIRLHSFPSYGTCWNMYLTGGFKCYCSFIIRTSCLTLNECALCSYGLKKHQGQLGLGPGDLQLAIEHTRSLKVAKKNMATILEKKNISSHGSSASLPSKWQEHIAKYG